MNQPFRAAALAALLALGGGAASALTITYVSIGEELSTLDSFAIAGNNGSGPSNGTNALFALPQLNESLLAVNQDADASGNIATGIGQSTQFTQLGVSTIGGGGTSSASAVVSGAGLGRGEGLSELKTDFRVDGNATMGFDLTVTCAADSGASCQSFVRLFSPAGLLFELSTSSGQLQDFFEVPLQAGLTYTLWARTTSFAALAAEGTKAAGASYNIAAGLGMGPGGVPSVPDPPTVWLMLAGIGGLLAWRRPGLR